MTFDLNQTESLSLATTGRAVLLRRIEPQSDSANRVVDVGGGWFDFKIGQHSLRRVLSPFTIGEQVECRERCTLIVRVNHSCEVPAIITAVSAECVEGVCMWRVSVEVKT